MRDWEAPTPLPLLTVASLGSMIKFQGKFTIRQWNDLQAQVRRSASPESQTQIETYMEKLRAGSVSPVNAIRPKVQAIVSDDATSIAVLSLVDGEFPGGVVKYVSGGKLIYSDGCIAFVSVAVDEVTPYATALVHEWILQISTW